MTESTLFIWIIWVFNFIAIALGIVFSILYEKLSIKKPKYSEIYKETSLSWVSFGLVDLHGSTPGAPIMLCTILLMCGVGFLGKDNNVLGFLLCIPPFLLCQLILRYYRKRLKQRILLTST